MLPPIILDDLVHDGVTESAKELGAEQFFPALQVGHLHLIFLMLVEEVLLEQS